MRIGIDFSAKKENGGVYQYCLSFLDSLKKVVGNEYVIFVSSPDFPSEYERYFEVVNLTAAAADPSGNSKIKKSLIERGYRILLALRLFVVIDFAYRFIIFKSILKAVDDQKIDLMIFLSGAAFGAYLKIPYIAPIHDLAHRKYPEFPEVSQNGRWQSRERYYRKLCQTAKAILVDSEIGKEDVLHYYQVDPSKVVPLPFLPPNYLLDSLSAEEARLLIKEYQLPEKFLFYPAQFWPHKNHLRLVRAIKLLKDSGLIINIVFSGSKQVEWGEFEKVESYVKANNLENQVWYLGYVSNQVMSALYKTAQALIMPTFFGPTNIPVLEAWKMSCPVIYSNIKGCREQLGEAGLLIDPKEVSDIAEKMKLIWLDQGLRVDLINKGKRRLSLWTFDDFSARVQKLLNDIKLNN
ncbi:MAG: glycosyltransferase family 1 protein [Candidatus Komeilibacteria bacterium]|nr:glycosyltransferase family 1 protein [Candidatus Komeilibacteria bacterium]